MLDPCAVDTGFAPGVRISNCVKLRPLSGISWIACPEITVPNSADDCCNSGASAVTVTVSPKEPTSSTRFCVKIWLTVSSKAGTSVFLNPGASTVST